MSSITVQRILFLLVLVGFTTCGGGSSSSNGETYTITFDANGGIGVQTISIKAKYDKPMPQLSAQAPVRQAAAQPVLGSSWVDADRQKWFDCFNGYFDAPSGGTKYYNADLTSARNWDKEEDAKLYAQWIPINEKYSSITLGLYDYAAPFSETAPLIDGKGNEAVWEKAPWRPIDQVWLGGGNASGTNLTAPAPEDFVGRFKIVWTEDRLYYLVEIRDSYLSLTRLGSTSNYWEDDLLELFINEDGLGGNHQTSHNAFAYHMSYNGTDVIDVGTNSQPIKFNEHLNYVIGNLDLPNRKSIDGTHLYTWEVEMQVFDKTYNEADYAANTPVKLSDGKMMRFAAAYCNAGISNNREYFMGSMFIDGPNKNVAWQNASVFAKLHLVK